MEKTAENGKRKRGCKGCLLLLLKILGVLLVIVLILLFFFYRVPERLGFGGSSEKMFTGTPDREASAAILEEAGRAGLNTQGVHLYVLPLKEGESSIAFALLQSTEGFTFPRAQGDPITQTLVAIGTTPTVRSLDVEVVGFEFYDEDGRSYMTIAARTDDIEKVSRGQMTQEEFIKATYGDIRFDEVFTAEVDKMQEFLSSGSQSQ